MKKTILYRLFRVGAVPKKLRPVLEQESILIADEGMGGWLVTKHVNGPGKRYRYRMERFSGCLVITKARVICYTYWKRQINISVKDPKIANLYIETPKEQQLCLSFELSNFQKGCKGVVEFRFNTDKALFFRDALLAIGVQQGAAGDADNLRL